MCCPINNSTHDSSTIVSKDNDPWMRSMRRVIGQRDSSGLDMNLEIDRVPAAVASNQI